MLCLQTNYEKVLVTLNDDKHEFHLAVSPEMLLLHDALAAILLQLQQQLFVE